jgi:hypothetical protein
MPINSDIRFEGTELGQDAGITEHPVEFGARFTG